MYVRGQRRHDGKIKKKSDYLAELIRVVVCVPQHAHTPSSLSILKVVRFLPCLVLRVVSLRGGFRGYLILVVWLFGSSSGYLGRVRGLCLVLGYFSLRLSAVSTVCSGQSIWHSLEDGAHAVFLSGCVRMVWHLLSVFYTPCVRMYVGGGGDAWSAGNLAVNRVPGYRRCGV